METGGEQCVHVIATTTPILTIITTPITPITRTFTAMGKPLQLKLNVVWQS